MFLLSENKQNVVRVCLVHEIIVVYMKPIFISDIECILVFAVSQHTLVLIA